MSESAITEEKKEDEMANFGSLHTSNFPELLKHLNLSLMVSTYQAGKVVILREFEGTLNTHFRSFSKPMGMAINPNQARLAIGSHMQVWEFHNVPAVCPKLNQPESYLPLGEPKEGEPKPELPKIDVRPYDACYMPRTSFFTGDIQIHEMAYIEEELWFINTGFSCLCTLSQDHSFVPRWRPKFVDHYNPGDLCHINGLAVDGGRIKYVTALGKTNTPGGWRENKRDGGLLIDITSDEIISEGLSMPHSPRMHNGELWLLNSGDGTMGKVDPNSGKYEPVVELPGFTRGVTYVDRYAFVGLSQIRESSTFNNIPLVEKLKQSERICGIYAVDLVEGKIIAFCKFEGAVQEIFAVEALRGIRFPEMIIDAGRLMAHSYILPDDALKNVK